MIDLPPKLWLPPKPAIIRPAPAIKQASFVPGWFPCAAVKAGRGFPSATVENVLAASISTTNTTSYNFGTVNWGAAPPAGYSRILLAIAGASDSNGDGINAVDIGGVPATQIALLHSGANCSVGMFAREVNTGTSGALAVGNTGNVQNCGVILYSIIRQTAGVAAAATFTSTADPHTTAAFNIAAGSVVIGGAYVRLPSSSAWTGLTENTDSSSGSESSISGASAAFPNETFGHVVSVDFTSGDLFASIVAVWGP